MIAWSAPRASAKVVTVEPEPDDSIRENKMKMPTIEKLLNFIQDRDARLGLVLSVFLLFLLVFTWFSGAYGGVLKGGFFELIRAFGLFLLLAIGFVIFFKAIDGSVLPRIIVWYFTSLVLLTVSAFWIQAIFRSPVPFLIEAKCFSDLWLQGCPLGEPIAQPIEGVPLPNHASEKPSQPESLSDHTSEQKMTFRPSERNKVIVQFAGSLSRQDVTKVSLELTTKGWNVQGADRGGERTAQAVGIDQVRFFHQEDAELAKQLATSYNELAHWQGFDQLAVAFVSGYESRFPMGYLEVWTSVD